MHNYKLYNGGVKKHDASFIFHIPPLEKDLILIIFGKYKGYLFKKLQLLA